MNPDTRLAETRSYKLEVTGSSPYLAPVDKPTGLMMRIAYWYSRRQFGKVPGPFSVFCARMPSAFASFFGKVSRLDKKLQISTDTAMLVRDRVHSLNVCTWCMDAGRWYAVHKAPHLVAKLDALHEYRTSPLFSDRERAALDFASELTETKHVSPETFAQLSSHYSERETCEIVWLVSSEHLYNINNLGLNIGSDGLCQISTSRSAAPEAS